MDLIYSVIFGIVEGFTEFLPVSSTGHLILTAKILNLQQTNFLKSFEIAIQLGAIAAVVVLYGRRFLKDAEVIKRIITAFIPTAVIGLSAYGFIKNSLLGNDNVVIWSLMIGGIILIIFEVLFGEKDDSLDEIKKISYKQSFFIGVFQSLAIIPGVSRAAATIVGGLLLGLRRKTIVEFSFLLAVPTMLAATSLDLYKNIHSFSLDQFTFLAVGFITSFVVAVFAIKFLLKYIKNHNFVIFGIYRILIALTFLLFS